MTGNGGTGQLAGYTTREDTGAGSSRPTGPPVPQAIASAVSTVVMRKVFSVPAMLLVSFQGGRLMVRYHVLNRPIVLGRGMV